MTQTIDQAAAALVAAGHKNYNGKFYDPRKRGAYVTLESGYCNAQFTDYVLASSASQSKGGPSGTFVAEVQKILEANRAEIAKCDLARS